VDSETLDTIASVISRSSIGVVLFVVLVQSLLHNVVMRRRGRARWAMLGFLIVHGGATVFADAFLPTPAVEGTYLRVLRLTKLRTTIGMLRQSPTPSAVSPFHGAGPAPSGKGTRVTPGTGP